MSFHLETSENPQAGLDCMRTILVKFRARPLVDYSTPQEAIKAFALNRVWHYRSTITEVGWGDDHLVVGLESGERVGVSVGDDGREVLDESVTRSARSGDERIHVVVLDALPERREFTWEVGTVSRAIVGKELRAVIQSPNSILFDLGGPYDILLHSSLVEGGGHFLHWEVSPCRF